MHGREAIDALAVGAYNGARRLDNTDTSYAWRKKMARAYVERAEFDACGLAEP